MILIFSTINDTSTQYVLNWLNFYKAEVILINELNAIVDIIFDINSNTGDNSFSVTLENGTKFSSGDITVVWYRRGLYFFKYQFQELKGKENFDPLFCHLKEEYEKLTQYMFFCIKEKTIGNYDLQTINKLIILKEAQKAGFKIPETRVLTNAKNAFKFKHINKNISEVITTEYLRKILYNRTSVQKKYNTQTFFPSLIQREILKIVELRVFIFLNKIFCVAIFPPKNGFLTNDIRDFTGKEIFRTFPYNIPNRLKLTIGMLLDNISCNTCSIDIIGDQDGNYYFLELNPVGQFGSIAAQAGFNIEKYIAQNLIKNAKSKKRIYQ